MLFAPIPSCFLARFLASRVENVRFDALLAHPCTTTRLAPCTTNMHTCPRILKAHARGDCLFPVSVYVCLPSMVLSAIRFLFLFLWP